MHFFENIKYLTLFILLTVFGQSFGADCPEDYVAPENPVWDGFSMTEPCTKGGFYIIDNAAKLAWFAAQTNTGAKNAFLSKKAKLEADLDMGGQLWTPIAAGDGLGNDLIFSGTFDGNGHSISNLYISAEELMANHHDSIFYAQNLGFIGCFKGTVENLNLVNIEVHGYGKGGLKDTTKIVDKPISIGTVVGWQSGDNSKIDGCTASGVVLTSGDGQAVGGIVGNIGSGTITNCMSTVSIKASGLAYVGGIAGYTKKYNGKQATISSCVYAGTELSAEGSAKVGNTTYYSAAGAIVGHQYKSNLTLSDVFYDEDVFSESIGASTQGTTNNTSATGVPDVNSEAVICHLNDGNIVDGECDKDSPWSVGENSISLNGSDGFTVTFDAKSGEFPDGAKKQKIILKDRIITSEEISTPVHADSAFAGWSLNPEATEPDANLGMISGATTVYAVWYPIYTITFSAAPGTYADGETIDTTIKVAKGDIISVTGIEVPTTYVKNGTTLYFTGWSDTPQEFEADYEITASDTLHLDGITATEDMTFYAAWTKAKTFTVTYNAHGHGKTKVDFVNVEKGQTLTEPPAPTPDNGYEYSGWCLDTTECDKDHHFDFETKIDKNYTLYADWNAVEYKIIYNLNGGSNNAGNLLTYTIEDADIVFLAPEKEGYNFKGWFYNEGLSESAKQITAGSTGDKAIYAKWEEKNYEITYMAGSGVLGSISPAIKRHGVSITLAEGGHYTLEGYSQDGWATEDGGDRVYGLGAIYSDYANLTLYPHWVKSDELVVTPIGAVTIYDYGDHKEAVINGEYTGEGIIDIPNDISVNSVVFNRTFTENTMSTLMLPFSIDTSKVRGGKIYRFKRVDVNAETGGWKVVIGRIYTEQVGANTPYLVLPTAKQMTFEGPVTFNTTTSPLENPYGLEEGSTWEYKGVYEVTDFDEVKKVENGTMYAFAGEPRVGMSVGKFTKIGTGVKSHPMRAYLVNHAEIALTKSTSKRMRLGTALPDVIDIEIEDEDGGVTAIGKLNTVTGEIHMDRWFDLKGRRLNSKPTVKGTYYKNGKKVIIK